MVQEATASLAGGDSSRVVLIGKSMGSRIGCHVAAENPDACAGVVTLGYPLKGMNGKMRDEVLRDLAASGVPALFVSGTRDSMGPLPEFRDIVAECNSGAAGGGGEPLFRLMEVSGGDHSLRVSAKVLKVDGLTQSGSDDRILAAIADFVAKRV